MIKRLLKRSFGIVFLLIFIVFIVFYRPDLTRESLEVTYFTENSHYLDITLLSLDGDDLPITLHYQDYGSLDDPVVLLLHGAFASSHTFEPWAQTLMEAGYRVIALDLPYHGLSGGFEDQVTSQRRSAAAIHVLLETLEIDTFFIGGNSMGGGVSWFYASQYHDGVETHVRGLILIDAVPPRDTQGGGRFGSPLLRHPLVAPIASKMTPKFIFKSILSGVYGSASTISDETVTRYYELLLKQGNRLSILANTREIVPADEPTALERMEMILNHNIPVLVMWGIEDSWISVDTVEIFRETLNLTDDDIIIYEGLGHVPMEENPALTSIDLLNFLNRHA